MDLVLYFDLSLGAVVRNDDVKRQEYGRPGVDARPGQRGGARQNEDDPTWRQNDTHVSLNAPGYVQLSRDSQSSGF
jgi:hypothetical protein